ncbi:alpha/beta hydrolase [Paenibacillus sp. N1-5-1-14]|uniref:alpha/beta hydrolase n=1 Tax=Paenibacillus radicibacter TaxID=2972488 RepID=UPI0021597AA4|nr:alpha/beta hydrolase [Paenibacillus radicibacter]MCR8642052.1 alpha/beta hydrolase [Paenibacillus radicibacter]
MDEWMTHKQGKGPLEQDMELDLRSGSEMDFEMKSDLRSQSKSGVSSQSEIEPLSFLWLTGWSMQADVWDEQIAKWPQYKHDKVDFTHCDSKEALLEMAEAALKSIASASTTVVIVGWSMGAMLALELAVMYPNFIQSMFLVGASGQFIRSMHTPNGVHERMLRRMRDQLVVDRVALLRAFDISMFAKSELDQGQELKWLKQREDQPLPSLPSLVSGLDYLGQFNIYEQVSRITMPIHILNGSEDTICSSSGAMQLAGVLSQGNCSIWEGVGHVPFQTNPTRFNNWMQERLQHGCT